jgi:cell wall-associated NlpC family hydrolase
VTAEIELLRRAHALFADPTERVVLDDPAGARAGTRPSAGSMAEAYWAAAADRRARLQDAREVDARLIRILDEACRDHGVARRNTGAVLTAAHAEAAVLPANPIAARELLRRRALRLRAQHAHVRSAGLRAQCRRSELQALRYRASRGSAHVGRAARAVRAALNKLGRPYVWGAAGPDRFDCSGLVQWAYAQAGVRLHRTTYEQIHDGVPVSRSDVRPGDLVFPHTGHVQLAIGGGMVVEAPQPGSTVRISRIGQAVAIRRPL